MGVMDVVRIDTEPARRAGEQAAKAYMNGVRQGLSGKSIGEKMASAFASGASPFTTNQLINMAGQARVSSARLSGQPTSVAKSRHLEDQIRWYKDFQSGSQKRIEHAMGEIYVGVAKGYEQNYMLASRNNIQDNIDRLQKSLPGLTRIGTQAAMLSGRPDYEASKIAESQVGRFKTRLDAINPEDTDKAIASINQLYREMSQYERSRRLNIDADKKRLAAEKEFNNELREEERLKKQLINLTDRYYKKTGLTPEQRAQYTDAINRQYTRTSRHSPMTHAQVMSGLNSDILATKGRLEALPINETAELEKYGNRIQSKWTKLANAWNAAWKAEGMNAVRRDEELGKMQTAYLSSIRNSTTAEQLRQIEANAKASRTEANQRKYDAETTGFTAMKAAARDRVGGVMSRYQAAYALTSSMEDAQLKRDVARREVNRMFRGAESQNDIRMINDYLDNMDMAATSLRSQGMASKKATTALNDFRKRTVDELDEISRLGDMFQATRREFGWNPFRNNRFFQSNVGIPGLPYITVGRRDRLNEQKDYIRYQLENAKDEAEINAIRKRFLFDERKQAYTQDLHMRERSSFWRLRDSNGSMTPMLAAMGRSFLRSTRILAAAWIGVMWFNMLFRPFARLFGAMTNVSDEHTRQRNMYNVTLGYNFTKGQTFEQWEDASFNKARDLRMSASEYRKMVMNAAPIFHTAVYGEDYKQGKVGVDGITHKQGERIITNMQQVETISTNLHRMAKISGSTDVEMQAAMRQIIQMVSKGRGNIQDIRPILESGGHMGDMIARFGFRANGAADLYGLNDKKQLTADRLLTNLLDEKTTKDLDNLMRRTRRTWEDTWALLKTDMNQLFMPTIRSFASSNQYGLGDKLLGYSGAIAQNKGFQDKILQFTDNIVTNLIEKWPDYVEQGIQTFGVIALIATYVGSLLKAVNTAVGWLASGWASRQAANRYDDVFKNVTGKNTFFDNAMLQTTWAINTLGGNLHGSRARFMTKDWARSASEQIIKYADLSDEEIDRLGEERIRNARKQGRLVDANFDVKKYTIRGMTQARDLLRQLRDRSSVIDDMGDYISMTEMRDRADTRLDEMHESLQNMAFSALSTGKISNFIKAGEEQKQKIEDSYLPEQAVFMNNVATGVGNIDKNTRKATQVQLAILKQVAGTRTINRVVHVSPNIVANVGTIRNGIEYEQLLKDLGTTVNHAVTAYAL
jgi:hypothetical protein